MNVTVALLTLVVSSLTGLSLAVGTFLAIRKYRKERIQERNETVRETVEQILNEMNPKLDTAVHELTNNSGTSAKDKVEEMIREMHTLRSDVRTVSVSVDKLATQGDFWARESLKLSAELAKVSERVAVVETITHGPLFQHTVGPANREDSSTKEGKRWPF